MINNFLFGAMMVWTGYIASVPGGSAAFEELLYHEKNMVIL